MDGVRGIAPGDLHIRKSDADDLPSLARLYGAAFPSEDLSPLLRDLMFEPDVALSLAGNVQGCLCAHVAFTRCSVAHCAASFALLGPLAVSDPQRGKGIGGALVRHGLDVMRDAGTAAIFVLGNPRFYSRLGFATEAAILPPYALPEAWQGAWQSLALLTPPHGCRGLLRVPPAWMRPGLWAP